MDHATLELVHEGKKIKDLLEKAGKSVPELARVLGVSDSAAWKQVAEEQIGDRAWPRYAEGLRQLGLDPNEVRRVVGTSHRVRPTQLEDLRPAIANWKRQHLEQLLRILDADDASRQALRWHVEDKLAKPD